jgi:teichuronic acid biosynthesis glycosyltransferase TuaG
MIKNLVSIVMPAFNCQDYLAESVESVIGQTYQNWELIIVDDSSTDRTVDIARKYASQDKRIRVISMENNSGPAIARNKAIGDSKGQYIAFLDSDDLWISKKLEIQISTMQQWKSFFCFASYTPFRVDGFLMDVVRAPQTVGYRRMLRGSVIGCLTVIYDASIIGRRYFSEGNKEIAGTIYSKLIKNLGHEDYMLWLNILKESDAGLYPGRVVIGINEPLGFYRLTKNSISAKKYKVALYQWIIYRRCEKFGFAKSFFYLINYIINGIFKHKKSKSNGTNASL